MPAPSRPVALAWLEPARATGVLGGRCVARSAHPAAEYTATIALLDARAVDAFAKRGD